MEQCVIHEAARTSSMWCADQGAQKPFEPHMPEQQLEAVSAVQLTFEP